MKKITLIILICLGGAIFISAQGQESVSEKDQLIEGYKKTISELTQKLNDNKVKIKQLEDEVSKKGIDEKNSRIKNQADSISKLIAEIERLTGELDVKNNDLEELKAFSKDLTQSKLLKMVPDLNIRYSEMDIEVLRTVYNKLLPYAADDSVKSETDKISIAIKHKLMYNRFSEILNNPLNAQELYYARDTIIEQLNGKMTEKQYDEFKVLDTELSHYDDAVLTFDRLIIGIKEDRDIAEYRHNITNTPEEMKSTYINQANVNIERIITSILLEEKVNEETISNKYFAGIPYLKNLYEEYIKYLMASPLESTPENNWKQIEEEVSKMVIEAQML